MFCPYSIKTLCYIPDFMFIPSCELTKWQLFALHRKQPETVQVLNVILVTTNAAYADGAV